MRHVCNDAWYSHHIVSWSHVSVTKTTKYFNPDNGKNISLSASTIAHFNTPLFTTFNYFCQAFYFALAEWWLQNLVISQVGKLHSLSKNSSHYQLNWRELSSAYSSTFLLFQRRLSSWLRWSPSLKTRKETEVQGQENIVLHKIS